MNNIKSFLLLNTLLLFSVILVGCVEHCPPLKPTDIPTDEYAYIYGRFNRSIPPENCFCKTDCVPSVALVITSEQGKKEYAIHFKKESGLYAVAVEPGNYYVNYWCGVSPLGEIGSKQYLKDHVKDNNFELQAGQAYYLGDFNVYCCMGGGLSGFLYYFSVPEKHFDDSTESFLDKYNLYHDVKKTCLFENGFFKDEFCKPHVIRVEVRFVPIVVPVG